MAIHTLARQGLVANELGQVVVGLDAMTLRASDLEMYTVEGELRVLVVIESKVGPLGGRMASRAGLFAVGRAKLSPMRIPMTGLTPTVLIGEDHPIGGLRAVPRPVTLSTAGLEMTSEQTVVGPFVIEVDVPPPRQ